MKNWKRYFALAVLVCFAVTLVPVKAHADAFTAAMIGQLAYGVATGLGITFTVTNGTATSVNDYMAGQVESYVNEKGGSLSSLFQGNVAITAAGNLLMANNIYNGITTFIDWLAGKNGLGGTSTTISETAGGVHIDGIITSDYSENTGGFYTVWPNGGGWGATITTRDKSFDVYYGNTRLFTNGVSGSSSYPTVANGWTITAGTNSQYYFQWFFTDYQGTTHQNKQTLTVNPTVSKIDWSKPGEWTAPQPLPDNKKWEGNFSGTPGFAEPPTDLPDFLSRVPEAIANGTLDVTGQITEAETGGDPPFPSPSPSPAPGPSVNKSTIALIIAEIISVINSLTGDTAIPEEQIESIADQITDSVNTVPDAITQTSRETQTEIKDATTTITDTITETETQTQTEIKDATTTITDTITDTTTEIKDAIQDQTQTQEDIKDAIQDLTDVPQDWEPQKRPLPRGVFPFCIPFDLHDFILALSAEPQTPEIHVPFDMQLPLPGGNVLPFHYQFDLDLHDFDGLAQVLRTLEFIAFGVGLLFVTGKVIKW